MSANTQVTTFLDLYTDLQERVREQTGVAATKAIAQRFINIALHDMHLGNGEKFPWCERQATLITQARYTDGTISVSKGSATITGVGTLWNTNNDFGVANMREGGKIVINGGSEVYEVSAIASDTSATLNSKYVTADVSGGGYCYFEDEYALDADFLRPLDLQNFDPSARFAAAVWGPADEVPGVGLGARVVHDHLGLPPPNEGAFTPFAFSDVNTLQEDFAAAGFSDVSGEWVTVEFAFDSPESFTQFRRERSGPLLKTMADFPEAAQEAAWRAVTVAAHEFAAPDGKIRMENQAYCAVGQR